MNRHGCRRCDWEPTTGPDRPGPMSQLADHHDDSGHPLCIACGMSLPVEQPQTCLPCIAAVRRRLDGVVELYGRLPELLDRLSSGSDWRDKGSRSDDTRLPGGDVLALLAGGSEGRYWAGRGVTINDNLPSDPPSVAFELSRWEDDWRQLRGEVAATSMPDVATAASYLARRMTWAADRHPAFGEFSTDIRNLHIRLEQATGVTDRPETGAPCMDCGAFLERRWTDNGLADEWVCPRCHRQYADAAYWLAVRAGLELEREQREAG